MILILTYTPASFDPQNWGLQFFGEVTRIFSQFLQTGSYTCS